MRPHASNLSSTIVRKCNASSGKHTVLSCANKQGTTSSHVSGRRRRALGFRDVRAAARRAYEHAYDPGALVVYTYGLSMSFAAGYIFGRWEVGHPSIAESVSCQACTGSRGSSQFVENIAVCWEHH